MKRYHVIVSGKVQGVFFRANAEAKANELGVKGWVRNTPDGNVEIVFEGSEAAARKMLEFCKTGPKRAKVEKADIKEEGYKGEFSSFEVVH